MKTVNQINEFIESNNIKNELVNNFKKLLENNSATDLDLIDKNVVINFREIEYKRTENNFHSFQTSILRNENKIGYYALVYDNDANLIDEFFNIFK